MLTLPAIDAHLQFFDPARDDHDWLAAELAPLGGPFGPEDLLPELELEGMTGSVLVQTSSSTAETAELLELMAAWPFVLGVVGWADLARPDLAEVIAGLRAGPEVARSWVSAIGSRTRTIPDGWREPTCAVAWPRWRRAAWPSTWPCARASWRPPWRSRGTCRSSPSCSTTWRGRPSPRATWRPGGGRCWPWPSLPNVVAKVSGLVTEAEWHTWSIDDLRHPVELAVDAFGAERLMLGSDWPRCLLAGSYGDAIDSVRYLVADLSAHEQAQIDGLTAARVYHLPGALA